MKWINAETEQKIRDLLKTCYLPAGLGEGPERACSIAAINISMTGEVTDEIPACMSFELGRWIIATQDQMMDDQRNCAKWKRLLPFAAGTGRECEPQVKSILINCMWNLLKLITPILKALCMEDEWNKMLDQRTYYSINEMTIRIEQEIDRIGRSPENRTTTMLDLLDNALCDYSTLIRSGERCNSVGPDVAYVFAKVKRVWCIFNRCGSHDRVPTVFQVWDTYDPYKTLLDCINITRDEQDGYISEMDQEEAEEWYRGSSPTCQEAASTD